MPGRLLVLLALLSASPAVAAPFEDFEPVDPRRWNHLEVEDAKVKITNAAAQSASAASSVGPAGTVGRVASEFRKGFDDLEARGALLREIVQGVLDELDAKRAEYDSFVACCAETLRADLLEFAGRMEALGEDIPVFARVGLDAARLETVIGRAPRFVLFALDEVLGRVPDWQDFPKDLRDVYDEIGDPEAFELSLAEPEPASAAASANFAAADGRNDRKTPTERFCERKAAEVDTQVDPIRLNRIKMFVTYVKSVLGLVGEAATDDVEADVAGQGTDIPNPVSIVMKLIVGAIEVLEKGVETHMANLEVCRARDRDADSERRALERDVAQCIFQVDYVLPGTRDDIADFVEGEVDRAASEGIVTSASDEKLTRMHAYRRAARWNEAYTAACSAYGMVGRP